MNATDCKSCQELSAYGIKCNHHRTESTSGRLIRQATEAGHVLTGTYVEQALAAERLLGARRVVIN
jgi:hypothetical protein